MAAMRSASTRALAPLALLGCLAAALAGCGSQTKTVSEAGAPTVAQRTASTASTQSTSSTPASTTGTTTQAPASTAGGTPAPTTSTRSAPEPAFTHEETQSEGLAQAVAAVRAHGYTPKETAQYHANQTLRVLVGTKGGSGEGYDEQAFFFVGGQYIGTDTKEASASVEVVSQGDTEVTLAYPLYRRGDAPSNPTGGRATVTFALNDGKLTALEAIPPASPGGQPGRL